MVLPIPVAMSNTPTDYTIRCRNIIWACSMAQLILACIRVPLSLLSNTCAPTEAHDEIWRPHPGAPGLLSSLVELGLAVYGKAALRDNSIDLNSLLTWGYFGILQGTLQFINLAEFSANSDVPLFMFERFGEPVIHTTGKNIPPLYNN